MDNNLFKPNTFTPGTSQPAPMAPMPVNSGPLSKITAWLKSHKKLAAVVCILFLVACILLLFGSTLKNRFFPTNNIPTPFNNTPEVRLPSSMQIKTTKTSFALTEKIPVSAVASSNNEAVIGFDTAIEYDPEALTLSKKEPPSITDFEYFSSNNNGIFRASSVLKPGSTPKAFDNTTLFEIEFTPKKPGKTTLKIIYIPGVTRDSNLLNSDSKDILGNARGVEIEIK